MLNSTFAGVGNRLVAQIIDFVILGIVLSLLIFPILGMGMLNSFTGLGDDSGAMAALSGFAILPIILAGIVAPVLYEAFMVSSAKQATVGKIIMKIKVVDENGMGLTFGPALGRSLIKYVTSNVCILLWLWPLFNAQEQALHDLVVKDYVVRA